jgi:Ricin-type beta-trefoil lectin domain/Putative Ig domain
MRRSIRASRNRILAIGASILLSGSALAAAAMPARAADLLPVNTVAVTNPGTQATNPIATAVLPITATESDPTATLTYTVSSVLAGPFTIATTAGPDNVTADITGAFTAAYTGQVTVTATAAATAVSSGGTDSETFTWTAADNTITFPPLAAQTSKLGTAVAGPTITATDDGGAAALPLSFSSTTLPPGLAIDAATGAISGTPTLAGTYPVTVTATDQTGATGTSTAFTWKVTPNTIVVKTTGAKTGWTGVKVSVQASATDSVAGQAATLTWSATGLPAGLAISKTTGLISGRPTRPSAATTTVTATDALGTKGSIKVVWNIVTPIVFTGVGPRTTTAGKWKDIIPYQATDRVPGDKPTFSATGLPPGMGFQAKPMLLYGWPTTAGTYSVTIHEKGSLGSAAQVAFKLTVTRALNKGATGPIHLLLDGKCLLDPGGKTANGTHVQIANCVAGATERWTVASDGTVRVNGRCLQIAGAGSSAGRQLELWGCANANPRQQWAPGTSGVLANPASGLCVADPGASRKNGTVPTMGACHVKSYEQWTLPAQPVLTALGGSCVDDHFSSGVNGNVVDMFWCNGTASQSWTFEPDGTLRLFGNKCIIVRNSKAVLWTCSSANNSKKWTVVRTSTMGSELTEGGVCLAIPGTTSAKGTLLEPNGTQLVTSKCSKTDPRDLWHIA